MSSNTADGAGQILLPEQETDVEVRREDQDNINLFGRLNARLHEVRDERRVIKVCSHSKGSSTLISSTDHALRIRA
jgi:hypothetical protein